MKANFSRFTFYLSLFIFIIFINILPITPPLIKGDIGGFLILPAQAEDLKIGQKAKGFYLQSITGEDIYLSDLIKEKNVVVLNFWATYCEPCIKEMPLLHSLGEKFKNHKKVKIFLIDVGEKDETVKEFIEKNKITLPVLMDRYKIFAEDYGILDTTKSLPQTFIINKTGLIIYMHKAVITDNIIKDIQKIINKAIKNSGLL